ncbi:hypothetical protein ACFFIX_21415 [Metabacillus herbersteinensis]|uniref:MFS transporter n=1 Tax=Metabacillus herbersteinensis TaxID=283816 RepID=A0ABV6GJS8_9BACI
MYKTGKSKRVVGGNLFHPMTLFYTYLGRTPITVLGPVYAEEVVNAGASGYGIIQAIWFVGIALGAFYIGNKKTNKLWITLSLGFGIQGFAQLAFGLSNHIVFSALCYQDYTNSSYTHG